MSTIGAPTPLRSPPAAPAAQPVAPAGSKPAQPGNRARPHPRVGKRSEWLGIDWLDARVAYAVAAAALAVGVLLAAHASRTAGAAGDAARVRRSLRTLGQQVVGIAMDMNATIFEFERLWEVAEAKSAARCPKPECPRCKQCPACAACPECPKPRCDRQRAPLCTVEDALEAQPIPDAGADSAGVPELARALEALRIILLKRAGRPMDALRVPPGAKPAEVRRARMRAIMVVHPDKAVGAPSWVQELCKEAAQVVNSS